MQLYPHWNARDNYRYGAKKKKRKRDKSDDPGAQAAVEDPSSCQSWQAGSSTAIFLFINVKFCFSGINSTRRSKQSITIWPRLRDKHISPRERLDTIILQSGPCHVLLRGDFTKLSILHSVNNCWPATASLSILTGLLGTTMLNAKRKEK